MDIDSILRSASVAQVGGLGYFFKKDAQWYQCY